MSVKFQWLDHNHLAVHLKLKGHWQWAELAQTIEFIMAQTKQNVPYLLLDLSSTSYMPSNAAIEWKNHLFQKEWFDSLTIITKNPFFTSVFQVVNLLVGRNIYNFHYVKSMENALEIIEKTNEILEKEGQNLENEREILIQDL
ncbi:hypothetical protein MASR2M15_17140 [Anaerolineales bacterium]